MTQELMGLEDFDTTIGSEEGAIMEVRSPKDGSVLRWPDGRPWTVTYYGSDSRRLVDFSRKIADSRAELFRRNLGTISATSIANDELELLVVATKCWDIPLKDGSPAANESNEFREAYKKYRWLREQGEAFCGTRGNFLKGTPKP
jgi:hypothetical protein